jgi:dihydroxyacetone kinase-like predicted kinase
VAAGRGLSSLFKELGCDVIINGGQTMNPSTEQILKSVKSTPAKTVFIFPNNKNIILAAQQSANLINDRKAIVIPSKTLPQGISALLAYDSGVSVEENVENMQKAMKKVSTGQITFAARDSEFGGFKIKAGSILALDNGKLVFSEQDPVKAVIRLIKSMVCKETEYLTVIYGEKISKEQADSLLDTLREMYSSKPEINMIEGLQPVYHFIVSLE